MTFNLFQFFCGAMVLNALASVAIAGVPLQWVSLVGVMLIGLWIFPRVRTGRLAFEVIWLIVAWGLCLTLLNWLDFDQRMPPAASSSYPVFILLRYLNILSFAGSLVLVLRLCDTGHALPVVRFLVNLGVLVALYAVYVYFAQLYGWPEPLPRSRIGTSGGEQSTVFTYAFHRAMGSFREPSHLAEWLTIPFILAFDRSPKLMDPRPWIIGGAILLTGSLTGILSLVLGLAGALAILVLSGHAMRVVGGNRRRLMAYGGLVLLLVLALDAALSGLLLQVVFDRSSSLALGGIQESNRDYVYEYADSLATPWLGAGAGNANIAFSQATGNDAIASYLSLYLTYYFGFGVVGFGLLIVLLAFPLLRALAAGRSVWPPGQFIALWAYLTWLVAFSGHSEEFALMFGVAYALLLHRTEMDAFALPRSLGTTRTAAPVGIQN